ncbi:MAG: HigA family addiction module antitoxin [Devosia marina]|uniref:HigA family addiction module antitoxin n=1 Tax=Devosia marina TaxID=2683198 RepID=UPI0032ED40F6
METHSVPPPGHFIREELEARGWSQRDLAYILGTPEQAVNMLLSGKRGISPDMAKALAEAFGVPAEFFMNLQKAHDLSRAREPDPGVSKRARLQSVYPVREMIKRGWLEDGDADLLEAQMVRFFGRNRIEDIPHLAHAAKKTNYEDLPPAQVAWLYRVIQIASSMVVPAYSEARLRAALGQLQQFMVDPEEIRHVPRLLAECGVRFLIVEHLPQSKIDGVCLWLDKKRPVIGMSLRHDRIDNYWFVLRHEIEHVLRKHGQSSPTQAVVDVELEGDRAGTGPDISKEEREANAAASDFCASGERMDSFVARKDPYFSERDILGLARVLERHPGLIVGQVQVRTGRWELLRKYLVKVRKFAMEGGVIDGWGQTVPIEI